MRFPNLFLMSFVCCLLFTVLCSLSLIRCKDAVNKRNDLI
ncbi:hypothetical protein GCWU000342_01819 [Shuttleworthella satelles DSM 14600]|uniref:Uncharacterized protein n=1 Tax=Shuttleworthella satelles DSM 14600 TaxID=626523 RepID=C4GCX5_9FIRM|nr:hypothetical protein GCWU000342_01819 [Shuttleworthia satelles DSM 14600]